MSRLGDYKSRADRRRALEGKAGQALSIPIPDAQLWSPTSPTLYDVEVTFGADKVTSYFGLRTFGLGDGPQGKRPV